MVITKENVKKLSNEELLICYNEYKRRWRLANKNKVKRSNDKHYNKYYKKKQEDILKTNNNQEDILINKKVDVGSIVGGRGLI